MKWNRSHFEKIDPAWLPAFLAAAELENFSRAAEATAMTQSGVSQHVQRLESALGVSLFHRERGRVRLSESGRHLREFADQYLDLLNGLVATVSGHDEALSGTVSYAMPESCLFANHFETILKKRLQHFPEINLKVQIASSSEIHDLVLNGEVDFGFVTERKLTDEFQYFFFTREEQVLIAKDQSLLRDLNERSIANLPFISYQGAADVFYLWRSVHFPRATGLTFGSLNVVGHCDSLFGVMTMVNSGVGVTVIAGQCCASLLTGRKISKFAGKNRQDPSNEVYMVTRGGSNVPRRVRAIIDSFLAMKSHA